MVIMYLQRLDLHLILGQSVKNFVLPPHSPPLSACQLFDFKTKIEIINNYNLSHS